jgi:hypothetical protein
MFDALTKILKKSGYGIHGFQKCATVAFESGLREPSFAGPFFLLGSAAEYFVNFYDRQPLPTQVAKAEFHRFESYVTILQEAFSSNNDVKQTAALNTVAAKIIKYRLS